MPQRHILTAVLRTISGLDGFPALRVLDLSCGEGALLGELHELGCRCTGTRFRSDDYIIQDELASAEIEIIDGVDLQGRLPFDDASFDVLIMTEVLEHLESHVSIVHEVGRLLRPRGWFIFSTPNIHRVHSRFQYLLTGVHKIIRRRAGWDVSPNELYAYHINMVSFPVMHTLLFQAGMAIGLIRFTQFKWRHAHWLAMYPLIWCATRTVLGGRRLDPTDYCRGERDLARWMSHPAMLFSEQLLVAAQRRAR